MGIIRESQVLTYLFFLEEYYSSPFLQLKMFLHNKAAIASQWGSEWRFGPFNLRPLPRRGLGRLNVEAGRVARAKEKAERLALRNTRRNAERAARRKAGEEAERLAKARRNAPPRRTQVPFLYSFFQLLFLGGCAWAMSIARQAKAWSQELVGHKILGGAVFLIDADVCVAWLFFISYVSTSAFFMSPCQIILISFELDCYFRHYFILLICSTM